MEEIKTNEVQELVEGKFAIKDFEEQKKYLLSVLPMYDVKEVNEDTYGIAKANRALLNKVSKALDTRRKDAQKKYMAPFNVGKSQYDELIKLINTEADRLGDGIKAMDDSYKTQVSEELIKYFYSECKYPVQYKLVEDTKWYNKGSKVENSKKEIDEKLTNISKDIVFINSTIKGKSMKSLVLAYYFKTLDLEYSVKEAGDMFDLIEKSKEIIDSLNKGE